MYLSCKKKKRFVKSRKYALNKINKKSEFMLLPVKIMYLHIIDVRNTDFFLCITTTYNKKYLEKIEVKRKNYTDKRNKHKNDDRKY